MRLPIPKLYKTIIAILSLLLFIIPASEYIHKKTTMSPPPLPLPDIDTEIKWSAEELKKDPNIIVVLSEAFWDITQLPGLEFSRDPALFFHELQKQFTHGTMLSPMFGGGTANVELEVLTGLSYRFFPQGSVVYEQYIKQPTESLASILKRQGYHATAVSPFHHWFFNSSDVYKHLGFERFISLEFFNPDEYVGPYIGDKAVANRIIEETERSPGADFVFANTMENHYHYWPNKFESNTIHVKGRVSDEAIGITETYAQGMSGADRMLQQLVSHFSSVKEPTIIVFFGDHLPSLEQYSVYEETGYISGENDPDFLRKMHEVPVLIWNNYLPREQKEELHFSPSFLGPYVLQQAARSGTAFTDYLNVLSKRLPILPPEDYYEEMHIDPLLAGEYQNLQQQRLEQEWGTEQPDHTAASSYILGYGIPEIQTFSPSFFTAGADSRRSTQITIKGGRFTLGSTAFLNGKPLDTKWLNENTLTATIPKGSLAAPGSYMLDVRVLDSKKNVLYTSAPISVDVLEKKR